jgi:hypothetical protein
VKLTAEADGVPMAGPRFLERRLDTVAARMTS